MSRKPAKHVIGRGTSLKPPNRFERLHIDDDWEQLEYDDQLASGPSKAATEYFIDQMPLPDALRSNVTIEYYEAGHMMYVHPPSLLKFRQDLAAFVDESL